MTELRSVTVWGSRALSADQRPTTLTAVRPVARYHSRDGWVVAITAARIVITTAASRRALTTARPRRGAMKR